MYLLAYVHILKKKRWLIFHQYSLLNISACVCCLECFFNYSNIKPSLLLFNNNFFIKTFFEVADNLSVCVLNILPKVNSLPSLLATNLMKMKI